MRMSVSQRLKSWRTARSEAPVQPLVAQLPASLRMPAIYEPTCVETWLAHVGDVLLSSLNRRSVNAVGLASMLIGAPTGISICTVKTTLTGLSAPATIELVVYAGIGWLGAAVVVANARFLVLPICWGTFQSLRRRQRMRDALNRRAYRLGIDPTVQAPQGLGGIAAAYGRVRQAIFKTSSS